MLELVVEAAGNTGGRYFPSTGYFGVTPVVINGTIHTRVPPLAQPLPVRRVYVSIKCIESRTSNLVGSEEHVLWEKTKVIWSAPEDYEELGAWSHPFKISIQPDVAKHTSSSLAIKGWQTIWRFDVGLEHKPIPYVGHRITKTFHLDILNHAQPSLPAPSPIASVVGSEGYATQVELTPPEGAFGPEDTLSLGIETIPVDPATIIKRATLVLERVVEFLESTSRRSPTVDTAAVVSAHYDLSSPLTLTLPKRNARWDIGETVRTRLVDTRFQLRLKLHVRHAKGRGTRDVLCDPIPVTLSATSTAERALARAAAPVKVRKHRSSRRGLYMQEGTVDISSEAVVSSKRLPSWPRSVSPFAPVANLKPILLAPDHPAQSQNISFVFPSPPPHVSALGLPSFATAFPFPSLAPSPDQESWSILKQFQHSGRRISTTASEEEAMQPSRSKQKLVEDERLPSLDVLGLGLPHVARRPMTAPAHMSSPSIGSFSRIPELSPSLHVASSNSVRPRTSLGRTLSEHPTSLHLPDTSPVSPQTFAFTVKEEETSSS